MTPPGRGGIAAIRVAGRLSLRLLKKHFQSDQQGKQSFTPFMLKHGWFCHADGARLDEVMAVYMPSGRSYTGMDQVEVYCHGGSEAVKQVLNELLKSGARAAEPGEFTRLAFLHGRIDLTQAEAVGELIDAQTSVSYDAAREHLSGAYTEHVNMLRSGLVEILAETEAAIDYPEDDIGPDGGAGLTKSLNELMDQIRRLKESYSAGRILRDGFKIVIAGRPNAGKSTLFNLLLRQERALVTATPGTTRDYLSEWIDIEGIPVNLIDTAGLRIGGSQIEKAGQDLARRLISKCDLLIWIVDMSRKRWSSELQADLEDLGRMRKLLAGNKIDVLTKADQKLEQSRHAHLMPISCLSGQGVDEFSSSLSTIIRESRPELTSGLVVTSARHQQKLQRALKQIRRAGKLLRLGESPELVVFELQAAVTALDEITGRIYNDEILDRIFAKFCIGK
ncbi:MAG: tRNA uridine-5-carboxymethylaminomethyl(34) synthesis GTPase MnmE [candidate division Zixibacteria bacterium]|nr:tRNA uridine-5-carboxymethylaminomethyl(34) synthesis GTPase MnmE [candidate division Zixibacteria bacterium]